MNIVSEQHREGVRWITVEPQDWVDVHAQIRAEGSATFDYLTAVHNSNDEFIVVSHLHGSTVCVVRTVITDACITSLSHVFAVAEFHERETAQMFGITFQGLGDTSAAFEGVTERALRKDFALTDRMAVQWPGAVEPDVNARRRPSLPPGVFEQWTS